MKRVWNKGIMYIEHKILYTVENLGMRKIKRKIYRYHIIWECMICANSLVCFLLLFLLKFAFSRCMNPLILDVRMYVCMHMYVCMCICMYSCVCMHGCMYMYVCMCMYECGCLNVCMYVCMHVCTYLCMCVWMCMYICMYV